MNQKPLVSVVIPTYNREKYIKKAIDSALNQTYKNIEIIIIDGSPDGKTEKAIEPYLIDPRVHYVHQEETYLGFKDRGASAARNKGIKISKGKYIAVLDDDDIWCTDRKIEKQVQFLENNPDYVACGGGVIVIHEKDPQGKPFYQRLFPEMDEDIREGMFVRDTFVHSSLVYRKSAWEKAGRYDGMCDDLSFWFRLGKVGKLYNFPEYFVRFLLGDQNKPSRTKYMRLVLKEDIRLIKKHKDDYPHASQGIFLYWLQYFYTFVPFYEFLRPIAQKVKHITLDPLLNKIYK